MKVLFWVIVLLFFFAHTTTGSSMMSAEEWVILVPSRKNELPERFFFEFLTSITFCQPARMKLPVLLCVKWTVDPMEIIP